MLYFTCYLLPKKARTLVPVSSPFLIGSIAFMLEFVVFAIVNKPSVHLVTTKKLHSFNGFFSTISHQIRIHIYWSFEYIIIYIRYSNEESLHFAWLSTKKVGHFDWAESFRNDKFDPNVISCEHFCCFFFFSLPFEVKLVTEQKVFNEILNSWRDICACKYLIENNFRSIFKSSLSIIIIMKRGKSFEYNRKKTCSFNLSKSLLNFIFHVIPIMSLFFFFCNRLCVCVPLKIKLRLLPGNSIAFNGI